MPPAVVSTTLLAPDRARIRQFVTSREAAVGFRPLSDQAWADLGHDSTAPTIAVHVDDAEGALLAYAQASVAAGQRSAWTVEVVIESDDPQQVVRLGRQVMAATVQAVLRTGGTDLTWLVQDPTGAQDDIAATFGLSAGRRLHQMRRSLPTGLAFEIETRPFDPDLDIAAWLAVNSRAFAWNPEQGGWTESTLRSRMDEPWFDEKGFLIHDRVDATGESRMAGFCWTKIHGNATPHIGEIYVIAVDPAFHGLGLGRALTLAGLDSLAERGVTIGMLYVDSDNAAGVHLYNKLGFVVHHTDCQYRGDIARGAEHDHD